MKSSKNTALKDFGPVYFEHVLTQFESFQAEINVPPHIQKIIEKHTTTPHLLAWRDLYALEQFVLGIQPTDVVKARAPSLEAGYKEVAGPDAYSAYLRAKPALQGDEQLRVALGRLLDALHWIYSMIPAREQMRSDILKVSGKWLLLCFSGLLPIILIFGLKGQTLLAALALAALMGSLGGFLSLQRRVQNIPTNRDPLLTMLELQNGRFTAELAPLLGAIFSIVLFFMFLGGLLSGPLFPEPISFGKWQIGDAIAPGSLPNVGKLLLWSFIAGFAERFVPDTLDRIASKGRRPSEGRSLDYAIEDPARSVATAEKISANMSNSPGSKDAGDTQGKTREAARGTEDGQTGR